MGPDTATNPFDVYGERAQLICLVTSTKHPQILNLLKGHAVIFNEEAGRVEYYCMFANSEFGGAWYLLKCKKNQIMHFLLYKIAYIHPFLIRKYHFGMPSPIPIRCRLQSEGWRLSWTSILFCSGLPHCMQSHSFLSTPLCCHTRHCAVVLGIFCPL